MKRVLLGAVGLSALLASCGGSVVVVDPVSNLQLRSYQSQYTLPTAYTDQNGTVYAAGSSVICDNLDTRIQFEADWSGSINEIGARLVGRDTGNTKTVYSGELGSVYSNGSEAFEFNVAPGVAPLSVRKPGLGAQGIVVTPVRTFTVKGASFLDIQARSADGTVSNVAQSVQALPVADCNL